LRINQEKTIADQRIGCFSRSLSLTLLLIAALIAPVIHSDSVAASSGPADDAACVVFMLVRTWNSAL
jgi:hypothetical protein